MNRRTFLASVSAFVAPTAMKGSASSEASAVPLDNVKLKVGIVSDTLRTLLAEGRVFK